MGRTGSLKRKSYIIFTVVLIITTMCVLFQVQTELEINPYLQNIEVVSIEREYEDIRDNEEIKKWLELRRTTHKNLSKLGKILFLDEDEPVIKSEGKTYQILVWKYGSKIENRHLKKFSDKKNKKTGAWINQTSVKIRTSTVLIIGNDIVTIRGSTGRTSIYLHHCSVKNCDITYSDSSINTANLVLFHLHRMAGIKEFPKGKRNPKQIWTFLTDESPYHTFLKRKVKMTDFNGFFNWSMTYRMDSDIPVPYGRTILKKQIEPRITLTLNKRRDTLIAILGSNCGGNNHRWEYVKELQKYIKVDVYGACGPLKTCPGHFRADCPDIDKYIFYLSLENSNCDEYITEKLWWNAYNKNSIPIVMGADVENYRKMLPLDSYINVDDFASPSVLAQFIYRLNSTGEFRDYYRWKTDFEVLNEHGYFKSESFHFCRICQALNYNNKSEKVYSNLDDFWNIKNDCHPAWNA